MKSTIGRPFLTGFQNEKPNTLRTRVGVPNSMRRTTWWAVLKIWMYVPKFLRCPLFRMLVPKDLKRSMPLIFPRIINLMNIPPDLMWKWMCIDPYKRTNSHVEFHFFEDLQNLSWKTMMCLWKHIGTSLIEYSIRWVN